jgi:hypothetical protein
MGMDLGNTMVSCPFRANDGFGDFYCVAGHTDCHAPFDERPEDCRVAILPERHGRLGDLDALMNNVGDVPYKGSVRRVLLSAPTIVPAEGGGEE